MSPSPNLNRCERAELACAYALRALAASEIAAAEAHIASCPDCQQELESLRPVVDRFVAWPTDVLRPTTSLEARLALRIAKETGKQPVLPPARRWSEPEWEQVAPGIECKLLATDTERHRVSMLVRLAPGASYPAHTHAGVEELHLLDGELWIDERKLVPGDYNYGAPGAGDDRVWSETGCTCVLVTSTKDSALTMTDLPHITRCGLPGIDRAPFERQAAEAERRSYQQDLEDFFENDTVALHLVAGDGTILRANQAELDLLGYTRKEYVGCHIAEFHADRAATEDILARLSRGERLDKYEARLRAKDGSIKHVLISSNVHFRDGGFVLTRCLTVDVTDRKQAEERTKLLAREVDHRAKNLLASVQAIVRMTQAGTVLEFRTALMGRLDALSRAHALLVETRWAGADLKRLVEEELAAYGAGDDGRVMISGPPLMLCANGAQVLAMALHELATNAAKYGALSAPSGRVAVEWSWDTDGHLALYWTETGGPPTRMPTRRGFGSSMIEGTVNGQLDGAVEFHWLPEGLACRMIIPWRRLLDDARGS